jgi:hypothetical protein
MADVGRCILTFITTPRVRQDLLRSLGIAFELSMAVREVTLLINPEIYGCVPPTRISILIMLYLQKNLRDRPEGVLKIADRLLAQL